MEALSAVTIAALTVYDMCKAVDRGMRIEGVRLLEKRGGKSGEWLADGASPELQSPHATDTRVTPGSAESSTAVSTAAVQEAAPVRRVEPSAAAPATASAPRIPF
jgi:hypothetical protein